VSEQVEEEASVDDVVKKLALMADAPGGLFIVDRELNQRVFVPPPTAQGAGAQAACAGSDARPTHTVT
jgi:ferritin